MRRHSINLYLCALAASDTCVATTAVVLYSLLITECSDPFISNLHSSLAPIIYPFSTIVQTMSIYFCIAAAVDCFVSTVLPNVRSASDASAAKLMSVFRNKLCTAQRAKQITLAVSIFSVLYNVSHFYELEPIECFEPAWNVSIHRLKTTEFRKSIAVVKKNLRSKII